MIDVYLHSFAGFAHDEDAIVAHEELNRKCEHGLRAETDELDGNRARRSQRQQTIHVKVATRYVARQLRVRGRSFLLTASDFGIVPLFVNVHDVLAQWNRVDRPIHMAVHNIKHFEFVCVHLNAFTKKITEGEMGCLVSLLPRAQPSLPPQPAVQVMMQIAPSVPNAHYPGCVQWIWTGAATKDSEACTICLDPFERGDVVLTLLCFHRFHAKCVKEWFERAPRCPECQTLLTSTL